MLEGISHCRVIFKDEKPVDIEYLAVNPAFEQITGLKDVVERKLNEVIPGYTQNNSDTMELFGRVTVDGKPIRCEHLAESKSMATMLATLTAREQEEMQLVIQGLTSKKIAQHLAISYRTVENYRSHIMQKIGTANVLELARISRHFEELS
jgi:DNA-binding CsgD family transcriptional regulator